MNHTAVIFLAIVLVLLICAEYDLAERARERRPRKLDKQESPRAEGSTTARPHGPKLGETTWADSDSTDNDYFNFRDPGRMINEQDPGWGESSPPARVNISDDARRIPGEMEIH